jgi:hypothetical protein
MQNPTTEKDRLFFEDALVSKAFRETADHLLLFSSILFNFIYTERHWYCFLSFINFIRLRVIINYTASQIYTGSRFKRLMQRLNIISFLMEFLFSLFIQQIVVSIKLFFSVFEALWNRYNQFND